MPVNTLSFTQISTILNSIHNQATGVSAPVATNTADFVTQANTALLSGFDTILNSINQVLSKTIFSVRPYSAKFRGLFVDEASWGNHVRKLSIADQDLIDNDNYKWPVGYDANQTPPSGNGQSVDPFVIHKPDILQTNFYGASVYEYAYTITRDNLDQAFRGPDELAQFVSMVVENRNSHLEQTRENVARMTVSNLIGSIVAEANTDRVIPVLTLYNAATGLTLTATSVLQPANYRAFMQWLYSMLAALTSRMTERSEMYQTVIGGKHIMRHTPYEMQRIYMLSDFRYQAEMMALADTFHDAYLRMGDTETVNYWQGIKSPASINLTAGYTDTTGAPTSASVQKDNVIGIIMDREAAGCAVTQAWSEVANNGRGGYRTFWDHATIRSWNDNTEKAVVLLME